jgi:C1A family cysteine protease
MAKSKKVTKKATPKKASKSKVVNKIKPKDKRFFGWTPDTPDHRDLMFSLPKKMKKLPAKVDLRKNDLPIFDQGALGSCTANAISTAFAFSVFKQQEEEFYVPSRLFIYYNERLMEGTVDRDSGAMLRDGIKSINKVGVCTEDSWPYVISKFKNKPTDSCYKEASDNKAVKYERLNRSLYDFKSCLASGFPFVGGFAVYESFQSREVAKTGKMPMPDKEERMLGGHAIIVMGYDDEMECFIVQNSWGTKWGDKGYFYMPYEYLTNRQLSDDFWVVQKVS